MIFIVIKVPFLKPLIQVMHFLDTKKHKEGERFVLYNILYYNCIYFKVQMRARREKLLNDVEKSDRLSREAKRRNRHSWGGNINGKIILNRNWILTYLT